MEHGRVLPDHTKPVSGTVTGRASEMTRRRRGYSGLALRYALRAYSGLALRYALRATQDWRIRLPRVILSSEAYRRTYEAVALQYRGPQRLGFSACRVVSV